MTVSGMAIEAHGLTKAYRERPVLRGLDLAVRRGSVACLLGPNGAGKTTTVEILEGYRAQDAGEVRVLGLDPAGQPLELRRRIGVVLQQCALPAELQVRELIEAYRDLYPQPRPTDELLELVELADEAHARVGRLSGGQQRRLDLALALAGNPELVFLDEPTTGFDPAARRRCWTAIRNLVALGTTVLLTTHYLDEAEELADDIVVLADGRILAAGAPHELADRDLAPTRIACQLLTDLTERDLPVLDGTTSLNRRRLTVTTRDPKRVVARLLAWDEQGPARLTGLTVTPPSLEDIYLTLTATPVVEAAA